MISFIPCAYFVLLFFQNGKCQQDRIEVNTNVGKIKGLRATDGDFYMYLGIPYAILGDNPFGPSTPYPPFNETFEAYDDSKICPQLNQVNNEIMGTLDCLQLHIYVPASINTLKSMSVMVWLYGGGFEQGQAGRVLYDPSYLLKKDVIIVSINYRVGPYGFMCLDIPAVSGNQGLKDQYTAIKWIKENIEAFGGKSDQITLFGQSAGGHSIDLHLFSTKDILFNKFILQSGSAEALTVLYEPDKQAPIKMAKYLGFDTNDILDALKYLSEADTNSVISASKDLQMQFKPCVEQKFKENDPFITRSWINAKVPKVKNMPVLMGFNKLEYASIFARREAEFLRNLTIVDDYLRRVFDFSNLEVQKTKDMVSKFYFGDNKINENAKWPLVRFLSDIIYIHPVHRTLQNYLDNGAVHIYYYMFSYVGEQNTVITTNYDEYDSSGNLCCASHNDELKYLFKQYNNSELTEADRITVDRLTTMWTNFAKYSNPTPDETVLLPVKWQPVSTDYQYYLNINNELTLDNRPLHNRMEFWDLFYRHNKKAQNLFSDE